MSSFDETELPLRVGFGSSGGPSFSTEVVVIDSGYERRNQNWSQARRVFDARTGVRSATDVATLLNFFHARAGRARGFRLRDWSDFTSSATDGISAPAFGYQVIATGDGTTVVFQIIKNYASGGITYQRLIRKPVTGSVLMGVNGTHLTSGWTVDVTTGLITFASAPVSGQSITAGFQFDVPLDEPVELYDVEIMNGASVMRTFSSLTSPTVIYTAAEQTADWGGSIPAHFTVNIYQISSRYGRGEVCTAVV